MPHCARSCKRGFDGLPAPVVVRLGNDGGHRVARGFAQNAGGLAGGIAIDFSAFRILAGNRDAGQLQRPGVGDGDVSVHALQKDGMVGGDFIDVPAAGEFLHRPQSLVPASADNPFAGSGALHSRRECDREIRSSDFTPPSSTVSR